jgi:hypothetical protein
MNASRLLSICHVGFFLLLTLCGCSWGQEPSTAPAKGKAVTVAHLAFIEWHFGPWWEPPGDLQQLKEFDEQLDPDVTGHQNHQLK